MTWLWATSATLAVGLPCPRRNSPSASVRPAWNVSSSRWKAGCRREINLDSYGRAASHLRRILETLGLERKARDVTPDGVELEVFSPMRARWAADAAAEGG